jgi:hypothetical protein
MSGTPALDRILDGLEQVLEGGANFGATRQDLAAARSELESIRELLSGQTMYDARQHALDQSLDMVRLSHQQLVRSLNHLRRSHGSALSD